MKDPKEAAEEQRQKVIDLLTELLEASGCDTALYARKIELLVNHIISATMLEIVIVEMEATKRLNQRVDKKP